MAIQQLDVELRQEKSMTDNLVGDMVRKLSESSFLLGRISSK